MKLKRFSESFFYVIFFIWYTSEILLSTDLEEIINGVLVNRLEIQNPDLNMFMSGLILVLLMIEIVFLHKYTSAQIIFIAVISIPIMLGTINSDNRMMMSFLLFVLAAKNADLEFVINLAFKISLVCIPLVIGLCLAGFLPDVTLYRHELLRHSFGFSHPNQLGMRIFQFVGCFMYTKRHISRKLVYYILPILGAWFVYRYPNSQTSYIGIILLIFLMFTCTLIEKYGIGKRFFSNGLVYGAIIANAGSIILSNMNINKYSFLVRLNNMLSHRFTLCRSIIRYYGITMWGQKVLTIVKDRRFVGVIHRFYLDNSYVGIVLRYGVVVFAIFSCMYIFVIKYYEGTGDLRLASILFAYSIYGIMENGIFSVANNIFLISFSAYLFSQSEQRSLKVMNHRIRITI
ncbi:hypothetical protein [Butyrivibrio sp. MB2005]|uniref:hypothetical protein n=1 Tax=Butyrivibrio sp. MB2005 TaxID=1280678 RepID=UPI00040C657F|nr:hypothetical protein [Butyrivibrio sp. MB2005]